MINVRRLHLYLGCVFAPMLIYFALSGSWQLYRLNDLPKNEPVSTTRSLLHEWSKPHTNATAPGRSPKEASSPLFNALALAMAAGLVVTSGLGIWMALKMIRQRTVVVLCLVAGVALPVIL